MNNGFNRFHSYMEERFVFMCKNSIIALLRSLTAVVLSAVIAAGMFTVLPVTASAECSMICKVTYSNKYTYLSVIPSDENHKVYYTADGSKPDENSKLYTTRLRASRSVMVRLVEYDENGEEVDRKKLTLKRKCCMPELESDTVEDGVKVTLSSCTDDVKIYYTTNGKKPTSKSTEYTEPFVVEEGTLVRAYAVKSGWLSSSYLKTQVSFEDSVTIETASEESSIMAEAAKVTDSEVILKIFEETNKYRAENGLPELRLDPELCKAASIRADELLASGYDCKHYRLDGRKWYTVLDEIGYNYSFGAENLARTMGELSTANTVIQMWIDSESHRLNMLNSTSESIGIAYTKNGRNVYWVQIYGKEK